MLNYIFKIWPIWFGIWLISMHLEKILRRGNLTKLNGLYFWMVILIKITQQKFKAKIGPQHSEIIPYSKITSLIPTAMNQCLKVWFFKKWPSIFFFKKIWKCYFKNVFFQKKFLGQSFIWKKNLRLFFWIIEFSLIDYFQLEK